MTVVLPQLLRTRHTEDCSSYIFRPVSCDCGEHVSGHAQALQVLHEVDLSLRHAFIGIPLCYGRVDLVRDGEGQLRPGLLDRCGDLVHVGGVGQHAGEAVAKGRPELVGADLPNVRQALEERRRL